MGNFYDVILVGLPGSGKTYLSRILMQDYQYSIIELGGYVYSESCRQKISTFDCFNDYFLCGDYLHFAKKAISDRNKYSEIPYVIVGPRTTQEFLYLCQKLNNPISIFLEADSCIREYRRSIQKHRVNIDISQRDRMEISWGVNDIKNLCDFIIRNTDNNLRIDLKCIIDIIMAGA